MFHSHRLVPLVCLNCLVPQDLPAKAATRCEWIRLYKVLNVCENGTQNSFADVKHKNRAPYMKVHMVGTLKSLGDSNTNTKLGVEGAIAKGCSVLWCPRKKCSHF